MTMDDLAWDSEEGDDMAVLSAEVEEDLMYNRAVDSSLALREPVVVVGLGSTGLSCVRFLRARGYDVAVTDEHDAPPALSALRAEFPEVEARLGELDQALLNQAGTIVLSPGVSVAHPVVARGVQAGADLVGEVDALGLPGGEGGGAATERQVTEPQVGDES